MSNLNGKSERLAELEGQWVRAITLMEGQGCLEADMFDDVESLTGVLKDLCAECAIASFDDMDIQASDALAYEGHESLPSPTCNMCGGVFSGMANGLLVLFEPAYAMKRWG